MVAQRGTPGRGLKEGEGKELIREGRGFQRGGYLMERKGAGEGVGFSRA